MLYSFLNNSQRRLLYFYIHLNQFWKAPFLSYVGTDQIQFLNASTASTGTETFDQSVHSWFLGG